MNEQLADLLEKLPGYLGGHMLLSADLVAVMNAGRLLQLGTPHELLTRPADEFVAALMATPRRQAKQVETLAAGDNGGAR